MNWRISNSANREDPTDIGISFEYYAYKFRDPNDNNKIKQLCTAIPIDRGSIAWINSVDKDDREHHYYVYATRKDPTSYEVDLDPNGKNAIYNGNLLNTELSVFFNTGGSLGKEYILNYSSNGYGICQERTYYLYDSGLGAGYSFDASDTSVNKNYPLVPIDDNTKAQRLYDVSGNTTTVGTLMTEITSNDELKKWYVEDVSKLGTDDVSKETKNLYCATNYFRYYKASSSEKGALYKYDKGYTVDSNLGTDTEGNAIRQRVKTLIDYSEFNLAENKYKIRVGNVYVYTRYAYKSVQYANLTNGLTKQLADGSYENYKPLPPDGNGYGDEYFSDYNFSEVIMLNYGGKIKRVSITSGAMANLDS